MKKALTIYIDDDCKLTHYNAGFVLEKNNGDIGFTMQNVAVGDCNGLFLPFSNNSDKAYIFEESNEEEPKIGNVDFYVRDKQTGVIHKVGDNQHDSIWVDEDGLLHYMNLQNGDGCSGASREDCNCGYEFVQSDCGAIGK